MRSTPTHFFIRICNLLKDYFNSWITTIAQESSSSTSYLSFQQHFDIKSICDSLSLAWFNLCSYALSAFLLFVLKMKEMGCKYKDAFILFYPLWVSYLFLRFWQSEFFKFKSLGYFIAYLSCTWSQFLYHHHLNSDLQNFVFCLFKRKI